MKTIASILFFISIISCKTEHFVNTEQSSIEETKQLNYEEKVYEFLNSIYKTKKGNRSGDKIAYIDNKNNLHKSVDIISDDLLRTVLIMGKEYNKVYIPDNVMVLQNWRDLKIEKTTDTFNQERIVIPNIRFIDSSTNQSKVKIIQIEGILFYDDFVIIVTNHGGTIQLASLFHKEQKDYRYITMTGYPPLGDE